MEKGLKERITGAAVLVILAVIFIPMLLDDTPDSGLAITETNIPPKPENIPSAATEDFSSRIIPLQKKETDTADAPAADAGEKDQTADVTPPEPMVSAEDISPPEIAMVDEQVPTHVGLSAWVVQLGSFTSQENAQSLNQKLRDAGYAAFVEPLKQNDTTAYRVRVGPELKRSDAQSIRDQLKKSMQLDGIVVQYP